MRTLAAGVMGLLLVLALSGCQNSFVDPLGRQHALKDAQKKYTELVRWGDLWRASAYVDAELRDDFLALAKPFEEIRVTEYDIGEIEDETSTGAVVVVTYHAFSEKTLVEKSFRERQEWSREGMYNDWQVKTNLDGLVDEMGVTP